MGERIVKCTVTRLAESVDGAAAGDVAEERGRHVVRQCFEVPFVILDVDECSVSKTNPMAHRCHPSTVCANTLGSYECLCPSATSDLDVANAVSAMFWSTSSSSGATLRTAADTVPETSLLFRTSSRSCVSSHVAPGSSPTRLFWNSWRFTTRPLPASHSITPRHLWTHGSEAGSVHP